MTVVRNTLEASAGAVIAAAMVVNMVVAGLSGTLIPLGLVRAGIDPALASSVFLTTVTDVIAFFAFLGLAAAAFTPLDVAFVTSSTSHVKAVTSIDGKSVGNGHVGELTSRMLDLYVDFIEDKGGPRNTNIWN